jgi:hypothetical protein
MVAGPELPPAGWWGKQRKIEKSYKVDELFEGIQSHAK